MLLFKKILALPKTGGVLDKRGAKRYPVGAKYALKPKVTLLARDGEGRALPADKIAPMDWGGQLVNMSQTGISIRLHPAAIAAPGEPCVFKMELGHLLFETSATVAHYRVNAHYATCGVELQFADNHTRRAYLQFMEPVVIGSTLEAVSPLKVRQDLPGLTKEQYEGESESVLGIWRDSGRNPKLFELLVHGYCLRGSTELPGLKITHREAAKAGKRGSRPAFPLTVAPGLKVELRQLFQLIVPNLGRGVPADVKRFLELFAA
jgi:hypothetical protein